MNETAITLGMLVVSKRTGKPLGKVVHIYRDGTLFAFVKGADKRTFRYQVIDLSSDIQKD